MDVQSEQYQTVRHLIYTRTGREINHEQYQLINTVLDELADLTGTNGITKFLNILAREPNNHQLWQYLITRLDHPEISH